MRLLPSFIDLVTLSSPDLLKDPEPFYHLQVKIKMKNTNVGFSVLLLVCSGVLEEKATACNMLCCYADELKEGFYPWIDQVAPTLVALLKFYFHVEVRKAVVSAMPELLRSAKLELEKGLAQGRNESYIKQLSNYIVPALVEALHKNLIQKSTQVCWML